MPRGLERVEVNHHRRKRSSFLFSLPLLLLLLLSLIHAPIPFRPSLRKERGSGRIIARTSFNYDTPRSRKRIESSIRKPQGWYYRLEKRKKNHDPTFWFLEKFICSKETTSFLLLLLCKNKIFGRKSCEGGNARVNSSAMKGILEISVALVDTTRNTRRRKHLAEDITYGGNRALGR